MFHLRLACLFSFYFGKVCNMYICYIILYSVFQYIQYIPTLFNIFSDAFEFDRHQARHGHNMLTFHHIPFHDMIQHCINITQKTAPVLRCRIFSRLPVEPGSKLFGESGSGVCRVLWSFGGSSKACNTNFP